MSIPKLKVYRLSQNGYTQTRDDDIHSKTNDELIPVVKKRLNPLDSEEMIGVSPRGDARMVIESEFSAPFEIKMDRENSKLMRTVPVSCDGWVLGKGNFKLFIKILGKSPDTSYKPDEDNNCTVENNWFEISRKFWDYEIITETRYGFSNDDAQKTYSSCWINGIWTEEPKQAEIGDWIEFKTNESDLIKEAHEVHTIIFKIGRMTTESVSYFTNGYDKYYPICTPSSSQLENGVNKIFIQYKKYSEFDDNNNKPFKNDERGIISKDGDNFSSDKNNSKYRVPFGNIYNGNDSGRCFKFTLKDTKYYGGSVPDGSTIDNKVMQYYEGNYLYKRKIFPLRVLTAVTDVNNVNNLFRHHSVIENGECDFQASPNWYMNGLYKPVLMERMKVDNKETDERYIFNMLVPGVQYKMDLNVKEDTDTSGNKSIKHIYHVSLNKNYYKKGTVGEYSYPGEIFLFYNEADDSLGNIFDFNYDYHNFSSSLLCPPDGSDGSPYKYKDTFGEYGYANRGNILSNNSNKGIIFGKECSVYLKREILAVNNDDKHGFDESRDIPLIFDEVSGNSASFTMQEKVGGINTDYCDSLGWKVYVNGINLYEKKDNNTIPVNNPDYDFSCENSNGFPKITISLKKDSSSKLPDDIMFSYYAKKGMSFSADSTTGEKLNPWCIGYRIPCYEKVKKSDLFVSSFPNWVQGHLDNDLDIFVGNKEYSGTDTSNTSETGQKTVNGLYPCYQKDGWNAFYFEGSVKFNSSVMETDYFDLFNFVTQMNDGIKITPDQWNNLAEDCTPIFISSDYGEFKKYYYKVKYNVAHYDGIKSVARGRLSNFSVQNGNSSYSLLEDDDYVDSIGKKWVIKTDESIKNVYETEKIILPEILSSGDNGYELCDVVSSSEINGNSHNIFRISFNDDRPVFCLYKINSINDNHSVILLRINGTNGIQQISDFNDISKDDIRIHIKLEKKETENEFVFKIGKDDSETVPVSIKDLIDEKKTHVAWYDIPEMKSVFDDISFDDVFNNPENVYIVPGEIGLEVDKKSSIIKYRYSNNEWYYDVYFEIIAYRHKANEVNGVEFTVYRVVKEK